MTDRRRVRSAALLAIVLVAAALAGCLGSSSTSAPEPGDASPDVVTDPTNYTYVDNASLATGGHIHDYWGEKDRIVVLDDSQSTNATWFGTPGTVAVFRPPAGRVIPQGAGPVEVTVSWTEEPQNIYEDPELWVKTAADQERRRVADIENGQTIRVDSTNIQNDLPHRQISAWEFALYIHGPDVPVFGGAHQFHSRVTMEVEAVRGLPIPVFPAHPNLWNGSEAIPLMDRTWSTLLWKADGETTGQLCFGSCRDVHAPANGTVVPFNASTVRVEMTLQNNSDTRVDLAYHAADTREWTRVEPDRTDGATRIYEIPLTAEMGDSPYAEQSLWRFTPYVSGPREDGVYTGGYRMQAFAERSPS